MPRSDKFGHEKKSRQKRGQEALETGRKELPTVLRETSEAGFQEFMGQLKASGKTVNDVYAYGHRSDEGILKEHIGQMREIVTITDPATVLTSFNFPDRVPEAWAEPQKITRQIKNIPGAVMQMVAFLATQFPDSAVRLWQQRDDEAGIVKKSDEGFTIALTPAQYMELAHENGFDAMRKLPPVYARTWEKINRDLDRPLA